MTIDENLLHKLEKLSHLTIDKDKTDKIISQLSDILEYVESLNELDTLNIDSYFSIIDSSAPLREDVANCNREISKSILDNAPMQEDNYFIVPAIIE